jgi:hypothetical protein
VKQRHILVFLLMTLVVASGSAQTYNKKTANPMREAAEPDTVFKILELSVLHRNFQEYRTVLADSFVYVADPGTVAMYPKVDWANWGITQEEAFIRKLMSPVLKASLDLTSNVTERGMPYDHKARYEITYKIEIEGRQLFSEATFTLIEVDHKWYLWKWEEGPAVFIESTNENYPNSGIVRASLAP